ALRSEVCGDRNNEAVIPDAIVLSIFVIELVIDLEGRVLYGAEIHAEGQTLHGGRRNLIVGVDLIPANDRGEGGRLREVGRRPIAERLRHEMVVALNVEPIAPAGEERAGRKAGGGIKRKRPVKIEVIVLRI